MFVSENAEDSPKVLEAEAASVEEEDYQAEVEGVEGIDEEHRKERRIVATQIRGELREL